MDINAHTFLKSITKKCIFFPLKITILDFRVFAKDIAIFFITGVFQTHFVVDGISEIPCSIGSVWLGSDSEL